MAKIEWSQVKMSDIQKNILTEGKEGTSAADALEARFSRRTIPPNQVIINS